MIPVVLWFIIRSHKLYVEKLTLGRKFRIEESEVSSSSSSGMP